MIAILSMKNEKNATHSRSSLHEERVQLYVPEENLSENIEMMHKSKHVIVSIVPSEILLVWLLVIHLGVCA